MRCTIAGLFFVMVAFPLASAGQPAVPENAQMCEACHGPRGQSSNPTQPSLAGQTSRYLYDELRDFASGRRPSVTMAPIAKSLSSRDMQTLADYFSDQHPMSSSVAGDAADAARGKSIADNSLCVMCHGAALVGQNEIPRIAGQQPAYIVKALEGFRDGRRTNDGGAMQAVVHGVSDQDIAALAHYIANLN